MTGDEWRAFLREPARPAMLATVRPDGRPHVMPVWGAWIDGKLDQAALYDALAGNRIAGAGIDVWWGPPAKGNIPPSDFAFETLPNVVVTPHYSGHARVTFERRAADIAANIANLAAGRPLFNIVRAAGGPLTEVKRTFQVTVGAQGLDLHFRPQAGSAIVSTVEAIHRP